MTRQHIVFLTGAGVSAESGLSTFRGKDGMWTNVMETNQRRPSKYRLEEHDMLNWFKATKKRIAKGELSEERLKKFNILLEVAEKYRRLNQYK